jgi:hypothetical protein
LGEPQSNRPLEAVRVDYLQEHAASQKQQHLGELLSVQQPVTCMRSCTRIHHLRHLRVLSSKEIHDLRGVPVQSRSAKHLAWPSAPTCPFCVMSINPWCARSLAACRVGSMSARQSPLGHSCAQQKHIIRTQQYVACSRKCWWRPMA